jgi:protein TonB
VSFKGGTGTSIVLHGLLVLVIILTGIQAANRLAGTGPGTGPAGGGGGGTGSAITYVELPAYISQTQGVRASQPEADGVEFRMTRTEVKEIARPIQKELFPQTVARVAPAVWRGRGGGSQSSSGAGPGTGGGVGSGRGTGIGSDTGPGTGGGRGAVLAPEPRAVIYPVTEPPASVRGKQLLIHFWVDSRGKVTKVLIEPDLAENVYTRELRESLYQWIFYPARTAEGRATEGELVVPHVP